MFTWGAARMETRDPAPRAKASQENGQRARGLAGVLMQGGFEPGRIEHARGDLRGFELNTLAADWARAN
jgi:hypothetical protein